jgi:outer membrane protein, multidrug efflux system
VIGHVNFSRRHAMCLALFCSACVLQPPANTNLSDVAKLPSEWSNISEASPVNRASDRTSTDADRQWWRIFNEPALDSIIDHAEKHSPTLALAVAKVSEAQASFYAATAAQGARINAEGNTKRTSPQSGIDSNQASRAVNAALSWEVDVFGRIKHTAAAAEQRLAARHTDAQAMRLSLETQIVDAVLLYRVCALRESSRAEDYRSRQKILSLTESKLAVGQTAPVDQARARSSALDSAGQLLSTQAQCAQTMNLLVAISGMQPPELKASLVLTQDAPPINQSFATLPMLSLRLPAEVLQNQPSVQVAMRNADAAFEEIGGAEAARRPSLNLSALLGSTWLSVGQVDSRSNTWSLASAVTGTLFDGGAGKANVRAARARYDQSIAQLQSVVRTSIQEIENALVALDVAQQKEIVAGAGLDASKQLFMGSELSYRAGRMSLFELEDARRALNNASMNLLDAQRDRAQGLNALIRATGNTTSVKFIQ